MGEHPQANTFPGADDTRLEPRWPLRALVCRACWLVQLDDAGPPEVALPGPASYEFSETMRVHAQQFVDDVLAHPSLRSEDFRVVELASHGAYLHPFLAERGVRSLIIEGSPALAEAAAHRGYPVLRRKFGLDGAAAFVAQFGLADLLIDNYLLAHLRDPGDFAAGLRVILKPGGLAVLEFDHVLPLVTDQRFDSIRHGHFSYLSLTSVTHLLERHGLVVVDVVEQPVYGGALRIFVTQTGSTARDVAAAVDSMMSAECRAGLSDVARYDRFAHAVGDVRARLRDFLETARDRGDEVVGYGAPSRASTLLNYSGITTELVSYTVDRSPIKQGRLLPGTGIPIEDPFRIFQTRPKYVLILTWDIGDEVRRQMAGIAAWGGQFVIPLPRLTVLS